MKLRMTSVGMVAGTLAPFAAGGFALILFLLDRTLYRLSALTASYTARAAKRLHRGWA